MGRTFVCIGHGAGVVMRHSVPSQAPLDAIRSRRSAWQAAVSPCNGIEVAPQGSHLARRQLTRALAEPGAAWPVEVCTARRVVSTTPDGQPVSMKRC
ncbi:hypothetical protein ACFPH6_16350 [Streptomyces xiangluensis]|uniref:Uncharacterized protein n=1 Tax=Streptomyces xiangluensis TaxID=2665720 RepID=A0ABV8YPU3_9ACTN